MKKCSLIVSVYNEEASLEKFFEACSSVYKRIGGEYNLELLFVDDGSVDKSPLILDQIAAEHPDWVRVIHFSRNFGHEAAMTAGLDYAGGDFLIFMDADLQHSPELIPKMLEMYREGFQVVSMVRTKNSSAGLIKNISSAAFYWILNHLSPLHFEANASDFFGISAEVQAVLKKYYREKVRYLRGYVQSVGFRKTTIEYEAGVRQGGKSHYSIRKLLVFSKNTLLFESSAKTWDFCLRLQYVLGDSSAFVHPLSQKRRSIRLCDHRGSSLLYVRRSLFCGGNHRGVYFPAF